MQTPALDHGVSVRLADDWMLLGAALETVRPGTAAPDIFLPEQLIQWNATLPGGAKFGVDAAFNLSVRTEVGIIEDNDLGPRLLQGWRGIEAGLALVNEHPGEPFGTTPEASTDLAALATETGWTFTERPDGRHSFDLPSPAGPLNATLEPRGAGGARLWVPLAELNGLTESSRHALAVMMLRAGTVLRLARAAFTTDGEQRRACLEVVFDSMPVAAELTVALESLAVGVSLAAAEAKLLCEEQTAREYLTVGTWTPREQGNNNNNNNNNNQK